MADQPPSPSRRRRPVDALFGDEDAPQLPSYVVNPPQPPATVTPPPPTAPQTPPPAPASPAGEPAAPAAEPADLAASSAPAPAPVAPEREPVTLASPPGVPAEPPAEMRAVPTAPVPEPAPAAPSAPAVTPSPEVPPREQFQAPTYQPPQPPAQPPSAPVATAVSSASAVPVTPAPTVREEPRAAASAPAPITPPPESAPIEPRGPLLDEREVYFAYLPETIRELYVEVSTQLSDSPSVADWCMKVLLLARQSLLDVDYAAAEYYVQQVDSKLKRNRISMDATASVTMKLLWAWQFVMLVFCGALVVIAFIPALTLFGLPIGSELVILMRAAAWGGIGGVVGSFYNMPWFAQHREYDPAHNLGYFARPLKGILLGAILFLLSQAGILAGNLVIPALPGSTSPEGISLGPIFLYVFAILAGFKEEYVYEFFDNVVRAVFRRPRLPDELQIPTAPVRRR